MLKVTPMESNPILSRMNSSSSTPFSPVSEVESSLSALSASPVAPTEQDNGLQSHRLLIQISLSPKFALHCPARFSLVCRSQRNVGDLVGLTYDFGNSERIFGC
jgi:hypothetical protein